MDSALFATTLLSQLYVRVGIWKHYIISLRGEIIGNKTISPCHVILDSALFALTLLSQSNVRVDIWKRYIISLRGEVCSHKIISLSQLFIEVPVWRHESERSCICVLIVSMFAAVSTMLRLYFELFWRNVMFLMIY